MFSELRIRKYGYLNIESLLKRWLYGLQIFSRRGLGMNVFSHYDNLKWIERHVFKKDLFRLLLALTFHLNSDNLRKEAWRYQSVKNIVVAIRLARS